MSLQDDALKLAKLERRLIKAMVEGDPTGFVSAVGEYEALRKRLKSLLLNKGAVSVEDVNAADIVRTIAGGEDLPADRVIERLYSPSSVDDVAHLDEFDDTEFEQIGSDIFYSWFSHYEYVRGLAELRPLVVSGSVPETVSRLIRQIKDCYAFQQYDAAYGLCRTVIEASVRDICLRCHLFPDLGQNVVLFEEFRWSELRDKVSSGALRQRLKDLYSDLCTVLHGRKTVDRKEARHAFSETLQVIEEIYRSNGV